MDQKKFYQYILLSISIGIAISFTLLFVFYSEIIDSNYTQYQDELNLIITLIIIRIVIQAGMTAYILKQWFKQEKRFFSDIPFLIGMYFYVLTIGKFFDIFWVSSAISSTDISTVLLLKIRYFIIILNIVPMLYLGLGIILFSLAVRNEKYTKEYINKVRMRFLAIFMSVITVFLILANDTSTISLFYPALVLPTLIGIIYMFIFAYKNQRLSQAHGLILGIGFLAQAISSIIRPVLTSLGSGKYGLWWLAEIIDLGVCMTIFLGFVIKPNFKPKEVMISREVLDEQVTLIEN